VQDELSAPAVPASVGQRVARQRRLCGLTQAQLAARAAVEVSLLGQVERGLALASPALVAAVARALGVEVASVYGQPYPPPITDPDADHAGIPALRAALGHEQDPDPDCPPSTPTELRARLDACEQHRAAGCYRQLTIALPEVLARAYALAHQARDAGAAKTAWALVTDACLLALAAAYRFGYLDLALLCGQHARPAAGQAADPLRVALCDYQRAGLRRYRGDYYGALLALERAHLRLAEQTSPAADALRVALHLREAIIHARLGTPTRAHQHLDRAADLLARGLPPSPRYGIAATATTLDIHHVAVAVELDDPDTALARAEQIKIPTGESAAVVGRYWIDLARAHTLRADPTPALHALHQARHTAPQLARYHSQVHQIVHLLTETARRDPDTLPGFARWAGLTPGSP
jgi:transcriptional regulator with XRE-family HTH domain